MKRWKIQSSNNQKCFEMGFNIHRLIYTAGPFWKETHPYSLVTGLKYPLTVGTRAESFSYVDQSSNTIVSIFKTTQNILPLPSLTQRETTYKHLLDFCDVRLSTRQLRTIRRTRSTVDSAFSSCSVTCGLFRIRPSPSAVSFRRMGGFVLSILP